MNYRGKRIRKKISIYTMARELGISKEKYKEVEDGLRNLEGSFMTKYLEVLKNAEEIRLNRIQKMYDVNEWIETKQAEEDMNKMGYDTQSLAECLNVTRASIYNLIAGRKVSDDLKEECYDFLHNIMNKQIIKETSDIYEDVEEELDDVADEVECDEDLEEYSELSVNSDIDSESKEDQLDSEINEKTIYRDYEKEYSLLLAKYRKLMVENETYKKTILSMSSVHIYIEDLRKAICDIEDELNIISKRVK